MSKSKIQSEMINPFKQHGDSEACAIVKNLGECWLVGGALRDAAQGKKFKDLDIVLSPCKDFRKKVKTLAKYINAAAFEMDAENQVWRLTGRGKTPFQLDIMPISGKNIYEDLYRRDFTINALALKLNSKTPLVYNPASNLFSLRISSKLLIDPYQGLPDLKNKKLHSVSAGIYKADPIRMLRAFRIAAEHCLEIGQREIASIKKHAHLIKQSAGERIREELLKLLNRQDSCHWIKKIHKVGLLFEIFPELKSQEKCAVDYYGKGGVWKHTLKVLERTDTLFARSKEFFPHYKEVIAHINDKQPAFFKFVALLHDVAKPAKAAFIGGRLRFFGHEECGAIIARSIMERLHFSKEEIKLASAIIGSHLRPGNLAVNENVSEHAMFRFFRAMGNATLPLLILCWADHSSYITSAYLERIKDELPKKPMDIDLSKLPYNSPKKTLRFMQALYLLARTYLKKDAALEGKLFIDGNDVLSKLNIKPGPEVGSVLEQIRLQQFNGKIKNKKEAMEYLDKIKKRKIDMPRPSLRKKKHEC